MNQRPGKRRTIHTYSSNVSRNSIYLINQQQKRRKEKTLRMLKKDIIEKSFTSSKAIERVSPNIHPITPESRGWISVLLSIDPKPVPNDLIRCFYIDKFYFSFHACSAISPRMIRYPRNGSGRIRYLNFMVRAL